jgi:hypothetical protein
MHFAAHSKWKLGAWLAVALVGSSSMGAESDAGSSGQLDPLVLLSRWRADVSWRRETLLTGDVTLNREADAVVLGVKGDQLLIAIVAAPFVASSKRWFVELSPSSSSPNRTCGPTSRARIELERLAVPEDVPTSCDSSEVAKECRRWRETAQLLYLAAARGGKGIRLTVEKCDSFHVYFDPVQRQPTWWKQ